MKRYLLTAASALVITAAASAQTFQISGEVTAQINYDGSVPRFDGPYFGGGAEDGLNLRFSGSGGGWDYEVENDFFTYSYWNNAQMKLTNDLVGTFELHEGHVEYSRYFFDDTLIFEARIEPSDLEDLNIGIEGQIGGIGYGVFRTTRLALIQLIPGGEREHSLTSFCGGGIAGAALGGLRYQLGKMKLKKTENLATQLYKNISKN